MPKQRPADIPTDVDFDGFLGKPVVLSELANALVALLALQAAQPARPLLARPDAHQLSDLLTLVRLGEVSAIEDWCAALRKNQPELGAYAQQVQQAAQELDFPALEKFAS
jgi:hypothetical protein